MKKTIKEAVINYDEVNRALNAHVKENNLKRKSSDISPDPNELRQQTSTNEIAQVKKQKLNSDKLPLDPVSNRKEFADLDFSNITTKYKL